MSRTNITIVEVANLRKSFSDLYCEILTGIEYSCSSIVRTNMVKALNERAIFNQSFTLDTEGCRLLTIYLKSKNLLSSDEVIGMVQIPISYFHHQQLHDGWYHFDKGNGSVHLVIQFIEPYLKTQSVGVTQTQSVMSPQIQIPVQPSITQTLIPSPPRNMCPYPGCTNEVTNPQFTYCTKSHALLAICSPHATQCCHLSGCVLPCFVDSTGREFDYCSRDHAVKVSQNR
jgi:hypothetical protein